MNQTTCKHGKPVSLYCSDCAKSYPPIPPNCPYFYKRGGDAWSWMFVMPQQDISWSICLDSKWKSIGGDETDKETRQIIAAVARCAWLDEAERCELFWMATPDWQTKREDAKDNAEAWRKWGKQK